MKFPVDYALSPTVAEGLYTQAVHDPGVAERAMDPKLARIKPWADAGAHP